MNAKAFDGMMDFILGHLKVGTRPSMKSEKKN
jgi:hypothetical protein